MFQDEELTSAGDKWQAVVSGQGLSLDTEFSVCDLRSSPGRERMR